MPDDGRGAVIPTGGGSLTRRGCLSTAFGSCFIPVVSLGPQDCNTRFGFGISGGHLDGEMDFMSFAWRAGHDRSGFMPLFAGVAVGS